MSRDPAIDVEGLGKRFEIARRRDSYPTLRDAMAGVLRRALGRSSRSGVDGAGSAGARETLWALRSVSFTVGHGEVVGVIGNNGAGKSTLLRILSRITEPSEGCVTVRGRVGSLLEVGAGFHPDLTGRENAYLSGVILGMSRLEVRRRFDEIVAFSGVGRFIDTPVKRYSSGMYLRLAFSVAAHLEAEVLLVDEVLAVGDAEFQRKCLGKIGEVASGGRTVLFVSHNLTAVQSLCQRALLLRDGQLVEDGEVRAVVSRYLGAGVSSSTLATWLDDSTAPGSSTARLLRVCVRPRDGAEGDPIDVRTPFVIELDYRNDAPGARLALSVSVIDEQGTTVFNAGPQGGPHPLAAGRYRETCHVPGDLMNDGLYRLQVEMRDGSERVFDPSEVLSFRLLDNDRFRDGWHGNWIGVVRPMLPWTVQKLDDAESLPQPDRSSP